MIKAIRGAITVDFNTEDAIKSSVLELLNEIMHTNCIDKKDISHVIFTVTKDIDAAFPAKFARIDLGWDDVAMMCYNEMDVKNSLKMCLRVMIVVNCNDGFVPEYVYLKGASDLRKS